MTTYLDTRNGTRRVIHHPGWLVDDGDNEPSSVLASDEMLAQEGIFLIVNGDGQYDALLETITEAPIEDWPIEDGVATRLFVKAPRPILMIKSDAAVAIDQSAEAARSLFVTQGAGQVLEYDETRSEIELWRQSDGPDINEYPMIRAEWRARQVADPSITVDVVVGDIVSEYGIWKAVGSAIKEIRRTAKVASEIAERPERVRQIVDWADAAYRSATISGAFEPLSLR